PSVHHLDCDLMRLPCFSASDLPPGAGHRPTAPRSHRTDTNWSEAPHHQHRLLALDKTEQGGGGPGCVSAPTRARWWTTSATALYITASIGLSERPARSPCSKPGSAPPDLAR